MRSKVILALAVVMSLLTTLLFYKYMSRFDTESAAEETMVDMITAKQNIKKNQMVSASMIERIKVPKKAITGQTVSDPAQIVGKFATADIVKGEPMYKHRLSDVKEETLFVSRKVRDGYRAVSVGVNFVQSVSNLIEPEDDVDVIVSITNPETKQVWSDLILQKVRVLAVGRKMVETDSTSPYVEYSSVTLELNPQDMVTVVNADERGNITLGINSRVIPSSTPQADK